MARIPLPNHPGIRWTVTRPTPKEGLDYILEVLRGRYNPLMSSEKFDMHVSPVRGITIDARVKVEVTKQGRPYGNVAAVYKGTETDNSTSERKLAQLYLVFFNMNGETEEEGRTRSYRERNEFLGGR